MLIKICTLSKKLHKLWLTWRTQSLQLIFAIGTQVVVSQELIKHINNQNERGKTFVAHKIAHERWNAGYYTCKDKPLLLGLFGMRISTGEGFILSSWLCSGEIAGAGRDADRVDWIFPLEMMYTVQKSGEPFNTLPGKSVTLNLLRREFIRIAK